MRVPFETTVIEKVKAPENLLERCPEPALDSLHTNKDIEGALGEAIVSLKACNKDKEDIREWEAE